MIFAAFDWLFVNWIARLGQLHAKPARVKFVTGIKGDGAGFFPCKLLLAVSRSFAGFWMNEGDEPGIDPKELAVAVHVDDRCGIHSLRRAAGWSVQDVATSYETDIRGFQFAVNLTCRRLARLVRFGNRTTSLPSGIILDELLMEDSVEFSQTTDVSPSSGNILCRDPSLRSVAL